MTTRFQAMAAACTAVSILLPWPSVAQELRAQVLGAPQRIEFGQKWHLARRASNGDLFLLSQPNPRSAILHRLTGEGPVKATSLSQAPAPEPFLSRSFMQAIAVNGNDEFHVGMVGHKPGSGPTSRSFFSGVVSVAADGTLRTTLHQPPVEVRRIAIDQGGNVYALGLDPDYLRFRSDVCLLVHKYAPDGRRVTAFSNCPGNDGHRVRSGAGVSGSPYYNRLKLEVERGQLWIDGGFVYHFLPLSWRVRVFDPGGTMIKEVFLTPPPEDEVLSKPFVLPGPGDERWIRGMYTISGGRYLVQWILQAGTHRRQYFAVHDQDGNVVSRPLVSDLLPIQSDGSGNVYFLRAAEGPGTFELVLARITVQ